MLTNVIRSRGWIVSEASRCRRCEYPRKQVSREYDLWPLSKHAVLVFDGSLKGKNGKWFPEELLFTCLAGEICKKECECVRCFAFESADCMSFRATDIQGILDGSVAVYTTPPKIYAKRSDLSAMAPSALLLQENEEEEEASSRAQPDKPIQFGE
jgi:hypothetical protein